MLQLLVTSPALSVMASHKYPMLLMLFWGWGGGVPPRSLLSTGPVAFSALSHSQNPDAPRPHQHSLTSCMCVLSVRVWYSHPHG